MNQAAQLGVRAEKTLETILEAAERIFAAKGFAATRMSDIAEEVGVRRASLVYYFKDKRALYDAVLESVFGDLSRAVQQKFNEPGPLPLRIESVVALWVDYAARRPAITRLILREIADAAPHSGPEVLRQIRPFFDLMQQALNEGRKHVARRVDPIEVFQFASMIAGSTLVFLTGIPAMGPESGVERIDEKHLALHREAMVNLSRHFLSFGGLPAPAAVRAL